MRKLTMSLLGILLGIHGYSQEIAIEKDQVFEGVGKVVVNADFCSLQLKGHGSKDLSFQGVIKSQENLEAYSFEIEQLDSVLNITVVKPEQWKSHWGEVILMLPEGMVIEAATQSGKVDVNGLKDFDLQLVSKSGHVNIDDSEGMAVIESPVGDLKANHFMGDLKLKTRTGIVDVSGMKGNCTISDGKGNITVKDVQGKLLVDGGSGSLVVENVEGDIALKATSGDTKLSLAKGKVSVKAFNGDVKLFNTQGVYTVQSSTGNITGTRVAFTAASSFTSTEGNIKVQMDTKDNLAFELKSSSSYLRAMGKSKKKSLKVGKGDILISGTSTTGSQSYY